MQVLRQALYVPSALDLEVECVSSRASLGFRFRIKGLGGKP